MKNKVGLSSAAAMLLALAGAPQATLAVVVDFEAPTYSIGETPGVPFTINANGNAVEVADTSSFASVALNTGSQSLFVPDASTSTYAPGVTVSQVISPSESSVLSFNVYIPSSLNSMSNRVRISIRGDQGASADVAGYYIQIGGGANTSTIALLDSEGYVANLGAAFDTWWKFDLAISSVDGGSDSVSLTITRSDGTVFGTYADRAFGEDIDNITGLKFYDNVSPTITGAYYVDNVTAIPEASSTGFLFALGAVLLGARLRYRASKK